MKFLVVFLFLVALIFLVWKVYVERKIGNEKLAGEGADDIESLGKLLVHKYGEDTVKVALKGLMKHAEVDLAGNDEELFLTRW